MAEADPIILRTKLHRPRLTTDMVVRPRLLELLDRGVEGWLTLVCAPAGFGKTTLVSSWIETMNTYGGELTPPTPAAWLSLDNYDSNLDQFLRYFINALGAIYDEACPETGALLRAQQHPPQKVLFNTLSNEIASLSGSFILVLDDFQTIGGQAVTNLIEHWIRNWPLPMHLVLITRKDPPLPLARLRASGKINEIRSRDLRFNENETVAFLDRFLLRPLKSSVITLLKDRTEGWIAGLKLAALWLRSAGDTNLELKTLLVADSGITDYLMDEVLSHQLPAIQKFLLKTSILTRFSTSLCEAVTGEDDPAWKVGASIDWLERLNLFVIPLDQRKEWYRYHPLFRELLLNRLTTELGSEQVRELYSRAADWFASQGQVEEALHYALEVNDHDLAARLMEQGLREILNRGDRITLERWLQFLPEEVVQKRPGLSMIKAWVLQFSWRLNAQASVLQQVERLLEDRDGLLPEDELRILRGQIAGMRAQEAYMSNQPRLGLALCQEALALLPSSWVYLRGGMMQYMGMCMQASGQAETADRFLLDAYEAHTDKTDVYALSLLFGLCFIRLMTGQLQQVRQIARLLLREANHSRLPILQSWGEYFLGMVHFHWNELNFAAMHFSRIFENRYTAQISVLRDAVAGLALIHQTNGEADQAQQMVELISQSDLEQHGYEDDRTRSLRAWIQLLQGDMDNAGRWIDEYHTTPPDQALLWLEEPQVTRVRILLARGAEADLQVALQILEVLEEIARRTYNVHYLIRILALQAIALDAQGATADALGVLRQSVELAQPGGFIQVYVNLGAFVQSLLKLLAAQNTTDGQTPYGSHLQRILAQYPDLPGKIEVREPSLVITSPDIELIEPLTDREYEILMYLYEPMSPKEIAFKLGISRSTVKRHTINLYGKLGVNSRWEAVARARALGILPAR